MSTSRRRLAVISRVNYCTTNAPPCYDDLTTGRAHVGGLLHVPGGRKPTRMLLKVNIERSLGPVQVILRPEDTVRDLIKMAVEIYVKEKRRPLLNHSDPDRFQLHYSQFSLENLNADEKLENLGSRNFFLCSRQINSADKSYCSEEANKATMKTLFPLTKLVEFLL